LIGRRRDNPPMSINLQTLKCSECGSGVLQRSGLNQYVCAHCGSVSVVEDDVSERLDRVLEQVKDAAAERLSKEQSARNAQQVRMMGIAVGAFVVLGVATALVSALLSKRGQGDRAPVAAVIDRTIPTDGLKLVDARQVLVGSGSSARPKLFVMARNETGRVLESPRVEAAFYDGENNLGNRAGSLPVALMMPGEAVPLLIDLPGDRSVTRQTLTVARLSEPHRSVAGPKLAFSRVRLVQQKDELRLVGRIVNTRTDATLTGVQVLATAYDDAGVPIAFGRGYAQGADIKPGERSAVEVRLDRFGGSAPVAAWDYRIDHYLDAADSGRTAVIAADRVVRTTSAPEAFNPELRMSTEDLLAEDSERFDVAQFELLPLIPGVNTIRQRTYMTELVNRSTDTIAVTPAAVISRFDGNRLDGTTRLDGVAYLYPGERLPVQVDPNRADRITQTRVEWKPMRRAALPGPRVPLEVKVDGTKAEIGSVLLNFSQRFSYKAVSVKGSVRNPGTTIVRKTRLWVSLRDKAGQLTGFKQVENLPAIGPGESVPFEVRIEQQGRDFASVDTLYQSNE
jgi:ribosomal protein S27AE